jgi:hypothetical protein
VPARGHPLGAQGAPPCSGWTPTCGPLARGYGKFGNAVLDAALPGTAWEDRLLGVNRMVKAPLYMTWYATGNNVTLGADTARRVCHLRLESPEERPEERRDLRHPDLLAWVEVNHGRLQGPAAPVRGLGLRLPATLRTRAVLNPRGPTGSGRYPRLARAVRPPRWPVHSRRDL